MGSNQSKLQRYVEFAEEENLNMKPPSPILGWSKKRDTKDATCLSNETFVKDKDVSETPRLADSLKRASSYSAIGSKVINRKELEAPRLAHGMKKTSSYSAIDSDVIIGKGLERDKRSQLNNSERHLRERDLNRNHTNQQDTGAIRKRSRKPNDKSTPLVDCNPKVKRTGSEGVTENNQVDEGAVKDRSILRLKGQQKTSGIQPAEESECQDSSNNNHQPANDSDINRNQSQSNFVASFSLANQIGDSAISSINSSTAVSYVNSSQSKRQPQTKPSSEFPAPNSIQTTLALYASNRPLLTTASSSLVKDRAPCSLNEPSLSLCSNTPVVTPNSYTPGVTSHLTDTQPSGITTSYSSSIFPQTRDTNSFVTTSDDDIIPSTVASRSPVICSDTSTVYSRAPSTSSSSSAHLSSFASFGYGNFSMTSSSALTSTASNGSSLRNVTISNSQFNFTGSSGYGSYSAATFNASSSFTSAAVSNELNYGYPNWHHLEANVEVDSLDLFGNNLHSQQNNSNVSTYEPPVENDRNRAYLDADFITIRTSVGDSRTKISAKNLRLSSRFANDELTDENMGIILERPKYPRYATLASRERSFENVWPVTNKISWQKLPEAGFVYTGTSDCVRCYYCNGGLREWLKNDCPWTEHARYYPHCPHVRYCKGDEFIRKVRNGTDDAAYAEERETDSEVEADGTIIQRNQEAMKIASEIISDRSLLEKAACYLQKVQGKQNFDAQELAGVAFDIEEGSIVYNLTTTTADVTDKIVDKEISQPIESTDPSEPSDSDSDNALEIDDLRLEEENRILKERSLCKVCLDATASVLFLDCGHMIACPMCAPALQTCAVCRADIKGTVRTIFATDR